MPKPKCPRCRNTGLIVAAAGNECARSRIDGARSAMAKLSAPDAERLFNLAGRLRGEAAQLEHGVTGDSTTPPVIRQARSLREDAEACLRAIKD